MQSILLTKTLRTTKNDLFRNKTLFKSCNIYLKPERFRKSKFTLSKVKSESKHYKEDNDNVNFDLLKRSGFKYILQLLNICLILLIYLTIS